MIEAIRYSLSHLLDAKGRDSRSTFWFYVLFLVIVYFLVSMVMSVLVGGSMMFQAVEHSQISNGAGTVDRTVMQQRMIHGMSQFMGASMWVSAAMSCLGAFLIAASFTRRLHDSGKPSWIAVLVIALYLVSVALSVGMMADYARVFDKVDMTDQLAMQKAMAATRQAHAWTGLVGWIPSVALLVFGVWPSSDGDNRYGPEPDHF